MCSGTQWARKRLCSRKMVRAVVVGCAFVALVGCEPQEPPHWLDGGAELRFAEASWLRGDTNVELHADGKVEEDGELVYVLDRVGRVVDEDYRPFAMLERDGELVGTDDEFLGQIGLHNAAPPWSAVAWLRVDDNGVVSLYGSERQLLSAGRWKGCKGAAQRSCTLVTHLFALEAVERGRRMQNGFYGPMYYPFFYGPGFWWY